VEGSCDLLSEFNFWHLEFGHFIVSMCQWRHLIFHIFPFSPWVNPTEFYHMAFPKQPEIDSLHGHQAVNASSGVRPCWGTEKISTLAKMNDEHHEAPTNKFLESKI